MYTCTLSYQITAILMTLTNYSEVLYPFPPPRADTRLSDPTPLTRQAQQTIDCNHRHPSTFLYRE